jgi:hypothetical protein
MKEFIKGMNALPDPNRLKPEAVPQFAVVGADLRL